MNAETLSAKARIIVHKNPAEVFAAFTDADAMRKFWFTRKDDGIVAGEPVTWLLEEISEGETILSIGETGFTGSSGSILARVLDSTADSTRLL